MPKGSTPAPCGRAARRSPRPSSSAAASTIAAMVSRTGVGGNCARPQTPSGVAASGRASELAIRPLTEPAPTSVLCFVTSAHKRLTPLAQQTIKLATALILAAALTG